MFPVKTLAFSTVTNVYSSKIPWFNERRFFRRIILFLFSFLVYSEHTNPTSYAVRRICFQVYRIWGPLGRMRYRPSKIWETVRPSAPKYGKSRKTETCTFRRQSMFCHFLWNQLDRPHDVIPDLPVLSRRWCDFTVDKFHGTASEQLQ